MTDELPAAPHSVAEWYHGYEEEGRLRGFRCPACGLVSATWALACLRCGHAGLAEHPLAPTGRIRALTLLSVPGDQFLNDAPYAYVLVDLDGGGCVTGWMPTVRSVEEIAIGDRVRFVPGYKPGVQFTKEGDASGG